jgi:Floricaula / Leafy protein SAM domain
VRDKREREAKPISNQSVMDPTGEASRWDQRIATPGGATSAPPPPLVALLPPPIMSYDRPRDLDELVDGYGVRYATMARIGELGFTCSTLIGRILLHKFLSFFLIAILFRAFSAIYIIYDVIFIQEGTFCTFSSFMQAKNCFFLFLDVIFLLLVN